MSLNPANAKEEQMRREAASLWTVREGWAGCRGAWCHFIQLLRLTSFPSSSHPRIIALFPCLNSRSHCNRGHLCICISSVLLLLLVLDVHPALPLLLLLALSLPCAVHLGQGNRQESSHTATLRVPGELHPRTRSQSQGAPNRPRTL